MSLASPLIERDRSVDGLFVKEVIPASPGGPATPLLMVHGALHGWWIWERWLPLLAAAGWQCSAMSLRNHTDSRAVSLETYLGLTAADYVADILTVMRSMTAPPVLIAHSMGALLAQKAAELGEAAGLVLICGPGPGQLGKLRDPLPLTQTIMRSPEDVRRFFFRDISDDALQRYYARLVPEAPGAINECNGGTLRVDRDAVSCPVLVVGGEADAVPLHPPDSIADFYGADLLMVPDGSHNFIIEAPSLPVAIRVNEWLMRCIDGPSVPRPTKRSRIRS